MPDPSLGIGHVPLQRTAFQDAKPEVAGVTTRTGAELEAIETWKRHTDGSTFTTLQWVLDWPTEPPAEPGGARPDGT
jgi:hypothetical protein